VTNNNISFLLDVFKQHTADTAIIWNEVAFSYEWLLEKVEYFRHFLQSTNVEIGKVIGLQGDFSPNSIALLLALIDNSNIIVPFVVSAQSGINKKIEISEVELMFTVDDSDYVSVQSLGTSAEHPLYSGIRNSHEPGLVLFTSGTSGQPKGAVHVFSKLLEKFKTPRTALKTVNFLLFDHWGGLNTLFHTLSNAGVVLTIRDRAPDTICRFVQNHKIELLPASPTFLNLLLISEAYRLYDLSSLKVITYGSEPMPESTLLRLNAAFPKIKIKQTYGLIELGVLRAKSKSDNSLWVKVGGEGYDLRIRDGILQIKADSAMLGYLNAPSPFTDDGYFITGDAVEVDGEFIKILGRKSEIINVGGEKVYPAEVESVIHEMENVAEVTVYGEKNLIMGMLVCAKVRLWHEEDKNHFVKRLKIFCSGRLQQFMIPMKISIVNESLFNDRFKKIRVS